MKLDHIREQISRCDFYIKKLEGPGWMMPNTAELLRDVRKSLKDLLDVAEEANWLVKDAPDWDGFKSLREALAKLEQDDG